MQDNAGKRGTGKRANDRQERLEAQLRENLKKRKQQARARAHSEHDGNPGSALREDRD